MEKIEVRKLENLETTAKMSKMSGILTTIAAIVMIVTLPLLAVGVLGGVTYLAVELTPITNTVEGIRSYLISLGYGYIFG